MKRVYAEIGIGNKTFLSTEIEKGNKEYRLNKFIIPKKLEEIYLRIWIIKLVIIVSFFEKRINLDLNFLLDLEVYND